MTLEELSEISKKQANLLKDAADIDSNLFKLVKILDEEVKSLTARVLALEVKLDKTN